MVTSTPSSADIARQRLSAQRIATTAFTRAEEAVAWLGAVQAQDYLGALWAVGLRLRNASDKDVERALAERKIVRMWPMRGTLHFVAAADARWMTELLAPRAVAAAAGRERSLGIDEPTLSCARRLLVKNLQGGRRLTRPAVYRILEQAKIATGGSRGLHVLWRLSLDCLICFGPREGKQHTFVLFDEWLERTQGRPREEALAELAQRYFTGHGPATIRDFAWWAGLTLADARLAVSLAGDWIEEATIDGQALWSGRSPPPSAATGARAHILPAFDEFLVGYADRAAAIESPHKLHVNAGGGILNPTIVVDGRVVGTWKRRLERREVVLALAPFAAMNRTKTEAVSLALQRYGHFLGLDVRLDDGPAHAARD
jgi:hypothetical protein